MSAPLAPLPPGWITQWDPTAGRNVFVETATGRTSYVPPTASTGPSPRPTHPTGAARMSLPPMTSPPSFRGGPSPSPAIIGPGAPVGAPSANAGTPPIGPGSPPSSIGPGGSRRRAYPTAHLAANSVSYSGGFDPGAQVTSSGAYGGMQPSINEQPGGAAAGAGGSFFTPGMPDQNQNQGNAYGQQQQPINPAINSPYGTQNGQGQQPNAGYPGQQGGVGGLTNQFAGMGMGAQGNVQKNPLYTVNLSNALPQIADLEKGPPAIQLPPNACISQNPKANAHPSYHRSTLNAIPTTHSLLQKSKLPLGVILSPYRSVREEDGDDPVPLVTDSVIARCRRCRTYINPYVTFIEGGNRWKCCMCNISNEVPQQFDWDPEKNQPADRWKRYELNHSVVEFVAPREYMVRPPQPPVYTFLIDVSHHAIQSGMVTVAAKTILETLDKLPNADNRTRICIIGVDTSLHFFCLPVGSTEPEMLVVSDLDDVFLPKPHDLLVNLTEGRAGIESLLSRLGEMFADNNVIGSALGAALQAAYKLVSPTGGKIMCLTASLPSVGPGALKNREDPKLLGTSKESQLLQAASTFYKTFPIDCSRSQVSVDMWLFGSAYTDVATLSCLPRYTGGQTYFYPAFHAGREEDSKKFSHEFAHVLASPICYEAVLRLRMTKGLRATSFHGNFFVRSTDLLALPAVPLDQSYAIECEIEETINSPFVVFQSVVMHSTSYGERRLRVTNLALPTTSSLSELYSSADQIAIITLLANKAVERSIHHRLEDARDALMNKLVDIFSTYKSTMTSAGSGASPQLSIASNMNLLPILTLALLKHVGIRASPQIPSDLRAYAQALLTTLPTQLLVPYLHPNFYCLHNMAQEAGTRQPVSESESNSNTIKEEDENAENGEAEASKPKLGKVIFPQKLNLSSERLERHGLYLIEDGQNIFLWVGREAVPQLCIDVFDAPNYAALKGGKTTLPVLSNSMNQRVNTLVDEIRRMRRGPYRPHLYIIKEDGEPSLRLWALSQLIEDRFEQSNSYMQFLGTLRDKVNGGGS